MTKFYETFVKEKEYAEDLQKCIEETVDWLLTKNTTDKHPGLLLGMIQSGKTRAFIGVIARAFDEGYDVAVVLTKGTKALAKQTLKRFKGEFKHFIDSDDVTVYDIMKLPQDRLPPPCELRQKLIFVVKKEDDNLHRLENFFKEELNKEPDIQGKRVLIIDDEADFASIGYRSSKSEPDKVTVSALAEQISEFRKNNRTDFLQVTATPYSLYLQPDAICLNGRDYQPVRPAFTSLVPIHEWYVGGKFYFEDSVDSESTAYHLHVDVPEKEIEVLGNPDNRYLDNILTTPNLNTFRTAIVNFIVAGSIRQLQNEKIGQGYKYKCSFIIHTETSKPKHKWQGQLVKSLVEKLKESITNGTLEKLIEDSYEHYLPSLRLLQSHQGYYIPVLSEVQKKCKESIGEIVPIEINSDRNVEDLLDEDTGQLRLNSPFNIFIGGQILDRGLTIENLIGFFYGRNPKRFQQDTVLQHSRMYGVRSKEDLAVTRLYTPRRIHNAMKKMYEFDMALREAFEKGDQQDSVVFIRKDGKGEIIPCAPSKMLIASTTTLKPHKRLLPIGFQTNDKTKIQVEKVEEILKPYEKSKEPFKLPLHQVLSICDLINDTFDYNQADNKDYGWDVEEFKSVIKHLCKYAETAEVYCLVHRDREISRRIAHNTAFSDSPDDGRDQQRAREVAIKIPCLTLLKQRGLIKNGWCDTEFWWPILMTPKNTKVCIFASKTQE